MSLSSVLQCLVWFQHIWLHCCLLFLLVVLLCVSVPLWDLGLFLIRPAYRPSSELSWGFEGLRNLAWSFWWLKPCLPLFLLCAPETSELISGAAYQDTLSSPSLIWPQPTLGKNQISFPVLASSLCPWGEVCSLSEEGGMGWEKTSLCLFPSRDHWARPSENARNRQRYPQTGDLSVHLHFCGP